MTKSTLRPDARRSPVVAQAGRATAAIFLVAMSALPATVIAAPVTVSPHEPGTAGPLLPDPGANPGPPEIRNQSPHNGVITPPGNISRMPVIHPTMPSNTPVIPPAGTPGGNQTVIPK